MKGLFNKVRNRSTRQRYVVSTIRKDDYLFETAIFEATFFYIPKTLSRPVLRVESRTREEAWDLHHLLARRLKDEYPPKLFQEYSAT
ncbi:MAG: hypothetical protein QME75_11225 [Deltaproteobacteria bacterium]|nr:hypothetical protein [Deltaproteobacteria bacterium]